MDRQVVSLDKLHEMGFESEEQFLAYVKIMRSLSQQKIMAGIAS